MRELNVDEIRKIFRDYLEAQSNINRILQRQDPNFFVKSPDQYLTPTVVSYKVPLDDERGELMHYISIRNALEKLLLGQPIEDCPEALKRAPDFIKDRLKSQ